MSMRRKPPKGNARRVRVRGNNERGTVVNKNGFTVQYESSGQRRVILRLDRDTTVVNYISQPDGIGYTDSNGKWQSFIPTFKVFRESGHIELWDVLSKSEDRISQKFRAREKLAHQVCVPQGWHYVIHVENSRFQTTEFANLIMLFRYRPTVYANANVTDTVCELLATGSMMLGTLIKKVQVTLGFPNSVILPALWHLLWHKEIDTDLSESLLIIYGDPVRSKRIWMP